MVYADAYPTVWPAPRRIKLFLARSGSGGARFQTGPPMLSLSPDDLEDGFYAAATRRGGSAGWWYEVEGVEMIQLPLSGLAELARLVQAAHAGVGSAWEELARLGLRCEIGYDLTRGYLLRCGEVVICVSRWDPGFFEIASPGWRWLLPVPLVDWPGAGVGLGIYVTSYDGYRAAVEAVAAAAEELARPVRQRRSYLYASRGFIVTAPYSARLPFVRPEVKFITTIDPVDDREQVEAVAEAVPIDRVEFVEVTIVPGWIGVGRRDRGELVLHPLLRLPPPYLRCLGGRCALDLDKVADLDEAELLALLLEGVGAQLKPGAEVTVVAEGETLLRFTYSPGSLPSSRYRVLVYGAPPYVAAPAARIWYPEVTEYQEEKVKRVGETVKHLLQTAEAA